MIFHTIFYKPCKEGGAHNNMHKNTQKSTKKLVKPSVLLLSGPS
jgi:hypothetical protein